MGFGLIVGFILFYFTCVFFKKKTWYDDHFESEEEYECFIRGESDDA